MFKKSKNSIYFDKDEKSAAKTTDTKKTTAPKPKNNTPTIIAKDLKLEGQILSEGKMEIEGMIRGTIKGNSVVLLHPGSIEGDIEAEYVSIRGKFVGNIKATSVNIGQKAELSGTIEYSTLSVEDGASVEAKFKKIGT